MPSFQNKGFAGHNDLTSNSQKRLLAVMKAFGLKFHPGGACQGVACTGVFAFVQKRGADFERGYIAVSNTSEARDVIQNQLKNLTKSRARTVDDEQLLDAFAMVQNISVNFNPLLYLDLFSQTQTIKGGQIHNFRESASRFIPDDKLADEDIAVVEYIARPYTRDELYVSLKDIKDAYETLPAAEKQPVGFLLENMGHAIGYGYDPSTGEYLLIDAEQRPLYYAATLEEVCEYLWNGLKDKTDEKYITVGTQVITTNANRVSVESALGKEGGWIEKQKTMTLEDMGRLPVAIKFDLVLIGVINNSDNLELWLDDPDIKNKINHRGVNGASMLELATITGWKEGFELLVRKGARVDTDLLIERAVTNAQLDMLNFILSKFSINLSPEKATQLLLDAVSSGDVKTLDFLFQNGAVIDSEKNNLQLVLAAIEKGGAEMLKYLIKRGATIDPKNANELFLNAVQHAQYQMVKYLLINVTNKDSLSLKSIFTEITKNGDLDILELFEKNVAPIERAQLDDLLIVAIENGHPVFAQILINKGASLSEDDINQFFLNAVRRGHLDMVKFLFAKRLDINFQDINGKTALHHAAAGEAEIVTFLMQEHADPAIRDIKGKTALHIAVEERETLTLQTLLNTQASTQVNVRDSDGFTPLARVAERGNAEMIEALVGSGAELNLTNTNDETALHIAIKEERPECVQALLLCGADTSLVNRSGQTAISLAEALLNDSWDDPEVSKANKIVKILKAERPPQQSKKVIIPK